LLSLFDGGSRVGLSDRELLEQFTSGRAPTAELAFAALVTRHGPMVWRVCRVVLDDCHDADDAFQATFLVLARKAGKIGRPEVLENWLYGTAHRVARKVRQAAVRRQKHERRQATQSIGDGATGADQVEEDAVRFERARLVHEELARLSASSRAAIMLCDLEGLTQDEASIRLRCSDRTLRRRLRTAHELLRIRLTRRGLAPAAGLLAAAWSTGSVRDPGFIGHSFGSSRHGTRRRQGGFWNGFERGSGTR